MDLLHASIQSLLERTHATGSRTHRGLTLVPLFAPARESPPYISLAAALKHEGFRVTEVSTGGSVPDLQVVNMTPFNVLLFDGQELKGAKQNRVLNTSILVPPESKLNVPVSCTEQGRWGYDSPEFCDSETIMSSTLRRSKSAGVTTSYHAMDAPISDQAEVWGQIEHLHASAGTSGTSRTRAMKDAFEAHHRDLEAFKDAFPCERNQSGLIAIRHGRIEGADVISQPAVYRDLHESLVKSYAMDALFQKEETPAATETEPAVDAQEFLENARQCEESAHDSPGLGSDHRLGAEHIRGSALVVDDTTVHLALFGGDDDGESEPPIASSRRRRSWHFGSLGDES